MFGEPEEEGENEEEKAALEMLAKLNAERNPDAAKKKKKEVPEDEEVKAERERKEALEKEIATYGVSLNILLSNFVITVNLNIENMDLGKLLPRRQRN